MKDKLKPYLLTMPVVLILVSVFLSGILMALVQSFGYFPLIGLEDFTLKYYREVLSDTNFLSSLRFSLYTSLVSSVISMIFGVLLAYSIYRMKGGKRAVESLYRIPLMVPHIVSALLVYNILSQTGMIPRLLYGAGLINDHSQFPAMLYDKRGIGIIIAYLWKEIPFVALTAYTILGKVSNRLSDVAHNLGANHRQVFFHVLLPLMMPSLFSAFIMIFAFSFGAYEVPFLLGPTQPKALPVQAFIEYNNPILQNRPYAMVYNIIIIGISVILTWLYFKAFERIYKYDEL